MQPLKKKKCPLLIHSNLELYILHTYIRLCGTVHLLEFDQKHTHKKKEKRKKRKKTYNLSKETHLMFFGLRVFRVTLDRFELRHCSC